MPATTPNFSLPYPVDSDKLKDLPTILYNQALAIESALKGFDFNGQDTNGLASRVTSLETRVTNLEKRSIQVASYSRTSAFSIVSNGLRAISSLTPLITAPELVTYANNAFKFTYDCVVVISMACSISPRKTDWTAAARAFIEFGKGFNSSTSVADAELGRVGFVNEDNAANAYSGRFAAGDTLTPIVFTNMGNVTLPLTTVSMMIQRLD
jgi:hypothetical protein